MSGSQEAARRSKTPGGAAASVDARPAHAGRLAAMTDRLSRGSVHRATRGAAWFALLASLALTVAAWRLADARERGAAHTDLETSAGQIASRLTARMLAYQQMLHGAAGLLATVDSVSRDDWRSYVNAIGLDVLPGIEGVGWAKRVRAGELAAHVEAARQQGVPDYRVFPPGRRDLYGPVTYLEPRSRRNLRAAGFDMYADPARRLAMQEARDSGRPSLTGRVVLVQEDEPTHQSGFLMYLPVYRSGAAAPDTLEARRESLLGWVYAPFRAADFVDAALHGDAGGLRFELRDARDGGASMFVAGMAAAPDREPMLRIPLAMINREWELLLWPRAPAAHGGPRVSLVIAVGGIVASLLIFGIVWTLATTRSRAVAIADRMTVALRHVNETLEARVRERTASLRDSKQRLATVNDKLRSVNAAFRMIGAPGPIAGRLAEVAAQLRTIVPAEIALAVAFGPEGSGVPAIGLDADPVLPEAERERWRLRALQSDRSGVDSPLDPGGSLTYRLQAPLLDARGRARGYLLLGRDVGGFPAEYTAVLSQFALLVGTSLSLHETLARERHARGEAERADRAKEEMLAVVSHELRTPLNAIQGWLDVLRRRRSDDAAMLDRAVQVIQRNLDTQVQLVDDLLDTAWIVGGKLRLALHPLDLVALLRTTVDSVRPLAQAKRITLSLHCGAGAFATVGDASRLEQVVWNLLTNAVKFTQPGGTVSVRLERLGWLAQLEVEDDGQGIEADLLPHVFDRFRQADSSSTRSAGGLGLGLALVRHIVQAHGGQVMVRSDGPGCGASFTVSLPLGLAGLPDRAAGSDDSGVDPPVPQRPGVVELQGPPAPAPSDTAIADISPAGAASSAALQEDRAAGMPEPLAGLSVLVVEDHDDSRELLAEFLAAQGARVLQAANGHDAMAQLRTLPRDGPPAALLCDIGLPGENGYALLARLRRAEQDEGRVPGSRLVAFALSAFTRAEDRERSLQAGFVEHLSKPLAQDELLARLRLLCDPIEGDRALQPR
jgi:signal transduction histidine kinase/CHASE1-domain containing sensor protein/ActR/RegA family two-component response regulator